MTKKVEKKNFFDRISRSNGILLHPTSLPGKFGIGELGSEAFKFIDILKKYNQKYWQILPLGPTGYGNSPYQCFSAFAGNPLLISIEKLLTVKLLSLQDLPPYPNKNKYRIDYGSILPWKWDLLKKSFQTFKANPKHQYHKKFLSFQKSNDIWLHDYALFTAIKSYFNNNPWNKWPEEFRDKNINTIENWLTNNSDEYDFHKFVQFLFFEQWNDLKKYCKKKHIQIIGDIPIFVSMDSADVWSNRHLFYVDSKGLPEVIAGVPPDYFSETGQRWGNPLYKWQIHKNDNYEWWKTRFSHILKCVDLIRIDHFRGFEAYWEIPASEPTAINGKWIKGPGSNFFDSLKSDFKDLPVIAENLGIITEDVENLRKKYNLPGMYILQFAFDDKYNPKNPYLPHNFSENNVVYTGTHDNDTILGWFENLKKEKLEMLINYFMQPLEDIVDLFIRECLRSVAKISIIPFQDILRIDNTGRMNYPGKESGNWEWRFDWSQVNIKYLEKILVYLKLFNRL